MLALFAPTAVVEIPEDRSFWSVGASALLATSFRDDFTAGAEISFVRHPSRSWEAAFCSEGCVGAFVQAESKPSVVAPDVRVLRLALGPQASSGPLGVELGAALETTPAGHVLPGVHAGAFLSVAFTSLGVRASVFPGRFGEDGGAIEGHLVLRVTVPFLMPLGYFPDTRSVESLWWTKSLGRFPM